MMTANDKQKVLIVGATGMLGHTLFFDLSRRDNLEVYATARGSDELSQWFPPQLLTKIQTGVDASDIDSLAAALGMLKPDVVINCVGIIKQLPEAKNPVTSITLNALFPHQLARACGDIGARMIHFSTDCVFSGNKGNYAESDFPDAGDLYGRSKYLGEVDGPRCVTLRSSIIGHELKGNHGLVEWLLAQEGTIRGFTKAVFSGFPTLEIANIIARYVIPDKELSGLYQVSSAPISKYDLLRLVAERYGKRISIEAYDGFHCDRSLDSTRFRKATGYTPPSWPDMIEDMWRDHEQQGKNRKS